MLPEPKVILVDTNDIVIGEAGKHEAHQKGLLHRAFSVFLFNSKNELLLQRRAPGKYHSPGLWTNTCCSHPAPGEGSEEAALRRLQEEMGIKLPSLEKLFVFTYRAELADMIENEVDHIFSAKWDGTPQPNSQEVSEWKWASKDEIRKQLKEEPNSFTVWFKMLIDRINS
jgi:isopentenyl-diphosphate delta-isomerase